MVKDELDKIRKPRTRVNEGAARIGRVAGSAVLALGLGVVLGLFSKWLDNLELESGVWWHRAIEVLDLGNFFSDIAIWLLIALVIAVFSASALRAALNVFVFFLGMCAAYHLYTIAFSGFNPMSYMLIWYGITLLSPLLAALCWYAKGRGPVAVILDVVIIAVFALSCFSMGYLYFDLKSVLHLLVFGAAVACLYSGAKQLLIALPLGLALAFLLSPFWPFQ